MPKLARLSGAETIRVLEKLGFVGVRQRGSHVVLKHDTDAGMIGCVVPMHSELATGTLCGILKQTHVDVATFLKNL